VEPRCVGGKEECAVKPRVEEGTSRSCVGGEEGEHLEALGHAAQQAHRRATLAPAAAHGRVKGAQPLPHLVLRILPHLPPRARVIGGLSVLASCGGDQGMRFAI
jgi:hypothetical protein